MFVQTARLLRAWKSCAEEAVFESWIDVCVAPTGLGAFVIVTHGFTPQLAKDARAGDPVSPWANL